MTVKKTILLALATMLCLTVKAQDAEFRKKYEEFSQGAKTEYEDFRRKANAEYSEFIRQAWQQFKAKPAIEKPKEEEKP